MGNWVQEFLYNDVRVVLLSAALFLGLLVFVLLATGLRSHRRAKLRQAEPIDTGARDRGDASSSVGRLDEEDAQDVLGEVPVDPVDPVTPVDEKAIQTGHESRNDLVQEIDGFEQGGNLLAAAKLCNGLADKAFDAADMEQAREYYLKGLSKASLVDAPEVQAVSRLMLGDISKVEGDLTTACEHWQLARDLYARCNKVDKSTEVEDKMRDNQCPTDWVLNEF